MDNTAKIVLGSAALIGGFLAYRYFIFGKGNKGLICPTTFGWRNSKDPECLEKLDLNIIR